MKELTKKLVCVSLFNGIEIWIEEDKILPVKQAMSSGIKLIELEGQILNPNQIIGIFTADKMEETIRRRNGEWKCRCGKWNEKGKKCQCRIDGMIDEELSRYRK